MNTQEQISAIQAILGTKSKSKSSSKATKSSIKNLDRHTWSISEERLAISLYKSNASLGEVKLAIEGTSLKLGSMKMKINNIRFLDIGEGLENVSSLTRQLWEEQRG